MSVTNRLAVQKYLGQLPAQQRTAVWATKALDYTQRETAEAMATVPNTTATHVWRAMAFLSKHRLALLAFVCVAEGSSIEMIVQMSRHWQGASPNPSPTDHGVPSYYPPAVLPHGGHLLFGGGWVLMLFFIGFFAPSLRRAVRGLPAWATWVFEGMDNKQPHGHARSTPSRDPLRPGFRKPMSDAAQQMLARLSRN
jgi:hypothetical protein